MRGGRGESGCLFGTCVTGLQFCCCHAISAVSPLHLSDFEWMEYMHATRCWTNRLTSGKGVLNKTLIPVNGSEIMRVRMPQRDWKNTKATRFWGNPRLILCLG